MSHCITFRFHKIWICSITVHAILLEKSLGFGRVSANIWCITVCVTATSCLELTLRGWYLLLKTASQAFSSLRLSCSTAKNEKPHQLPVGAGTKCPQQSRTNTGTGQLVGWMRYWPSDELETHVSSTVWINTAIWWLKSRCEQCWRYTKIQDLTV